MTQKRATPCPLPGVVMCDETCTYWCEVPLAKGKRRLCQLTGEKLGFVFNGSRRNKKPLEHKHTAIVLLEKALFGDGRAEKPHGKRKACA